jgi:hypothetical protein
MVRLDKNDLECKTMHCKAVHIEEGKMKYPLSEWRRNRSSARLTWGRLDRQAMYQLKSLTMKYGLSIAAGDIQRLDGRWYVTHSGLVGIAQRRRCSGIRTTAVKSLSDPNANRWVFKATVYKTPGSAGFVGYGDANPANVSTVVLGAEMRIAETRAVNRALRKAYGIGLCSVEELGSSPYRVEPTQSTNGHSASGNGHRSTSGEPKLRDRLCLLIRKYELDSTQVKRYAANFCGTETLRDAGRDLVESFISTLADEAANDRGALICKLNSYGHTPEVTS